MVGHRFLLLALFLLALLPASAVANPATEIIVKREGGLNAAERAEIRADADVRLVERLPLPRTEVVAAERGDVQDALRDLNRDPDVVYAEPNRPVQAFTNDEFFDYLWGLENHGDFLFGSDAAVADADMDVPDAWTHSTGAGRTVAVVDSGVDAAHPDLGGRVTMGWDFVENDPYANDEDGHGTHVAGTIAAERDNVVGIAGVAPDTRILPLRVLDEDGQGTVADVIKAYDYAGDHDVAVVNASLGGEGFVLSEYEAIQRNPNTLFVVAAGNGGLDGVGDDNDSSPHANYPCAYNLPNILCVGASKHDDERATFSNFGETTVDVFAPGYGIYSTLPNGEYDFNSGTSMATPHVSGLAALLIARNTELAPADVKNAVLTTAEPKPDFANRAVSEGRANADDALLGIDFDSDGVVDGQDNCPALSNPGQEDVAPADGIGDACAPAPDADGDGVTTADDCPAEPAAYAADGCPSADPTADGDYWPADLDQCPGLAGTAQGCPDADGDGVPDGADNCDFVSNANQANLDGDAWGNACDPDRDGDTVPNGSDACPDTRASTANGCPAPPPPPPAQPTPTPTPPADRDGDGRYDVSDACPSDAAATKDGCPLAQVKRVKASVKKRRRKRSATVRITTTRVASLKVTVQRKRGRRWVRVKRSTEMTSRNRATVRVSRLKRGRYRVRVSITSSSGRGKSVTKCFRVR